jgi:transcriptional antiterminator Rof (Rho-off)
MKGSFVQSAAGDLVVRQSQNGEKVEVAVEGLTLYLMPDDAIQIGAAIVTVGAQIKEEIPF